MLAWYLYAVYFPSELLAVVFTAEHEYGSLCSLFLSAQLPCVCSHLSTHTHQTTNTFHRLHLTHRPLHTSTQTHTHTLFQTLSLLLPPPYLSTPPSLYSLSLSPLSHPPLSLYSLSLHSVFLTHPSLSPLSPPLSLLTSSLSLSLSLSLPVTRALSVGSSRRAGLRSTRAVSSQEKVRGCRRAATLEQILRDLRPTRPLYLSSFQHKQHLSLKGARETSEKVSAPLENR